MKIGDMKAKQQELDRVKKELPRMRLPDNDDRVQEFAFDYNYDGKMLLNVRAQGSNVQMGLDIAERLHEFLKGVFE